MNKSKTVASNETSGTRETVTRRNPKQIFLEIEKQADYGLMGIEMNLDCDYVEIWQLELDRLQAELDRLASFLSNDEIARAENFRFKQQRLRFLAGRGYLRKLLGQLLETAPEKLMFSYSANGKPKLLSTPSTNEIHFNVSHSRQLILIAISRRHAVGVDVEWMNWSLDINTLSSRFFSAEENNALARIPIESRHQAFFQAWTRKEAYLKGLGDGLSRPLNSFTVSLLPNEPPRLLTDCWAEQSPSKWSLFELHVGGDFIAALAVECKEAKLRCRVAPDDIQDRPHTD